MRPGDFLDDEPLMLLGYTGTELTAALVVSSVFWLPVSVFVLILTQNPFIALVFFLLMFIASIWFTSLWWRRLKQSRPPRFHLHYLAFKFHSSGIFKQCQHRGSFNL